MFQTTPFTIPPRDKKDDDLVKDTLASLSRMPFSARPTKIEQTAQEKINPALRQALSDKGVSDEQMLGALGIEIKPTLFQRFQNTANTIGDWVGKKFTPFPKEEQMSEVRFSYTPEGTKVPIMPILADAVNLVFRLPELPARAVVTGAATFMEAHRIIDNAIHPEKPNRTYDPINFAMNLKMLGYEEGEYKPLAQEYKDFYDNGYGTVGSFIMLGSSKTLDITIGAAITQSASRAAIKKMAQGGAISRVEAHKAFGGGNSQQVLDVSRRVSETINTTGLQGTAYDKMWTSARNVLFSPGGKPGQIISQQQLLNQITRNMPTRADYFKYELSQIAALTGRKGTPIMNLTTNVKGTGGTKLNSTEEIINSLKTFGKRFAKPDVGIKELGPGRALFDSIYNTQTGLPGYMQTQKPWWQRAGLSIDPVKEVGRDGLTAKAKSAKNIENFRELLSGSDREALTAAGVTAADFFKSARDVKPTTPTEDPTTPTTPTEEPTTPTTPTEETTAVVPTEPLTPIETFKQLGFSVTDRGIAEVYKVGIDGDNVILSNVPLTADQAPRAINVGSAKIQNIDYAEAKISVPRTVYNRTITPSTQKLMGVEPSRRITQSESTLLKNRIRDVARGTRDTIREVKKVRDDIKDMLADYKLSAEDYGRIARPLNRIVTKADLDKNTEMIIDRIENIVHKGEIKRATNELQKTLSKTKLKKTTRHKFTPEIQEELDILRAYSKMDKEQAGQELAKNIEQAQQALATEGFVPFEISTRNQVLSTILGDLEPIDIESLNLSLKEMIKTGREGGKMAKSELQKEYIEAKEDFLKALQYDLSESQIRTGGYPEASKWTKIKGALKTAGQKFFKSYDMALDTIEWGVPIKDKFLADKYSSFKHERNDRLTYSALSDEYQGLMRDVYGKKNTKAILNKLNEMNKIKNLGKFENAAGDMVEIEMTKQEAIKRYMEFKDSSIEESFIRGNLYTDEIKKAITDSLSTADKRLGDLTLEKYREVYEIVNPVFKKKMGFNLPKIYNYSNIRRTDVVGTKTKGEDTMFESLLKDVQDRIKLRPDVTLKRTGVKTMPIAPQGVVSAYLDYIDAISRFVNYSDYVGKMQRIISDPMVRKGMEQRLGPSGASKITESMKKHLKDMMQKTKSEFDLVDWFNNASVKGTLMGKPLQTVKQMTSNALYLSVLNPYDLTVGIADFLSNPLKHYKEIHNESSFIRLRTQGMERDLNQMSKARGKGVFVNKKKWDQLLMSPTKIGDKIPIVLGSWAYRRKLLKQVKAGKITKQQMIDKYEDFANKTQQSSYSSQQSDIARGGPLGRIVTRYSQAQMQMMRLNAREFYKLFQDYGGDYGAWGKQFLKYLNVLIATNLASLGFLYASKALKPKREEIIMSTLFGRAEAYPIFGQTASRIFGELIGARTYPSSLPIWRIEDDGARIVRETKNLLDGKEDDFNAFIKSIMKASGSIGLPGDASVNMYEGVEELAASENLRGILRMFGYTNWSLEGWDESGTQGGTGIPMRPSGTNIPARPSINIPPRP